MTTKRKIVLALLAMMLVVIMLAVVGYRTATEANRTLEEYSELSELNFLLSDCETEVYRLAYNMSQYMNQADSEYIEKALKGIEGLEGNGTRIVVLLDNPELAKLVSDSVDGLEDYKRIVVNLEMRTHEMQKEYQGQFSRASNELSGYLGELSDFLYASGRNDSFRHATLAMEYLSLARVNIGLFTNNLRDESLLSAEASFRSALESLLALGALDNDVVDSYKQNVRKSYEETRLSFESIKANGVEAKLSLIESNEFNRDIMGIIAQINAETARNTTKVLQEASEDSADTRMLVIIISAFGLVLCLVLSVVIILRLTRTLKGMVRYAENIAQGNFDYKNNITERGEIGQVVDALAQIPVVLREQVGKAVDLANHINSGCLRERLIVEGYEGGFGQIAKVINSVADSYTAHLDKLPLVIFTGDKDCTVQYLNCEAERVLGPVSGSSCAEAVRSELCNTKGSCSGRNCMTSGELQKSFATAHPKGNELALEYSSSPLRDLDGNIAGFIGIMNDLTQIKGQQETMLRVARRAEEISGRVATASEELAAQVEQISQGTELQKQRMDSTASAMSQMNSSVLEVARSAAQASEQSEKARKQASTGSELVGNVVNSVNNVNEVSTTLQTNMEELGHQVDNIGGIMDVISDIADQTNLLALNAAIEAARAGDAGRGFAVVADEVRKLAEKTMLATQEVGNTISAIQEATRMNISGISTAVTSVSEATRLADKSGQALREIVELAVTTSQLISSIATAAEEQSVTSDEISQAVEDINRVTAETATGMYQSSSAIQELSDMAQQLKDIIGELQ